MGGFWGWGGGVLGCVAVHLWHVVEGSWFMFWGLLMPLSSELGTDRPANAKFWPWLEHFQYESFKIIQVVSPPLGSGRGNGVSGLLLFLSYSQAER